jgi:hypothetical protein
LIVNPFSKLFLSFLGAVSVERQALSTLLVYQIWRRSVNGKMHKVSGNFLVDLPIDNSPTDLPGPSKNVNTGRVGRARPAKKKRGLRPLNIIQPSGFQKAPGAMTFAVTFGKF